MVSSKCCNHEASNLTLLSFKAPIRQACCLFFTFILWWYCEKIMAEELRLNLMGDSIQMSALSSTSSIFYLTDLKIFVDLKHSGLFISLFHILWLSKNYWTLIFAYICSFLIAKLSLFAQSFLNSIRLPIYPAVSVCRLSILKISVSSVSCLFGFRANILGHRRNWSYSDYLYAEKRRVNLADGCFRSSNFINKWNLQDCTEYLIWNLTKPLVLALCSCVARVEPPAIWSKLYFPTDTRPQLLFVWISAD